MKRQSYRDMPQVDLVMIPELGEPRSLIYSDVTEARLNARGFARKGPQKIVAWYILDDEGLVLSSHGCDFDALKKVRPDAHTLMEQKMTEEVLSLEQKMSAWN